MKKENNDNQILKSSLSTLIERFSSTDVISNIEKEYLAAYQGQLSLSLIDDNHIYKNIKYNKNKLNEEMERLKNHSISRPLIVYLNEYNRYEVIYPRILYHAARHINFDSINVYVVNIEEQEMLFLMALEIKKDKDVNIVELSYILNKLIKKYHLTQKDLSLLLKMSRPSIANIIRLKHLPVRIQNDLINKKISFGHVRAFMSLSEEDMNLILDEIYEKKLSVRETEKIIFMKKNNLDFSSYETILNNKYDCKTLLNANRVEFRFDDSKKFNSFLKKLLSHTKK